MSVKEIWERFCNYELGHLHMVMELFQQMERRDPAEILPQTLPEQVLTDPRTSLPQCLQAILTAELTDNAGWELLIKLADNLGQDEMKAEFEEALEHEEEHLQNVRAWLSECVLEAAEV